ncbi:hypothetical protein [Maribacter sp. 2-571]|uniref:hypothetical protein n=1 Tax=Maribacter sp. 2-571 TaxID=3417569 RepID=UPI003D3250FE
MLKKTLLYSLLAIYSLCCTSCFDILEEINIKNDGTGSMLVTFNMSKSKTKLASIMMLDSINGHKVPSEDEINLFLKDVTDYLEKTEGIGNIKKTKDFDNYIFTVSCDFKDVEQINGIFKDMIIEQNKKGGTHFSTKNFAFNSSEKTFHRYFTYDDSIKKSFNHLKSEDQKVFQDASLTAIYRFENPVTSISNTKAKVSPNKKAVMLKVGAMDFIMGKQSLANKIQLSK